MRRTLRHASLRLFVSAPLLVLVLVGTVVIGVGMGPVFISPADGYRATVSPDANPQLHTILWDIRIPRVLLGMLVGAALAVSGAIMQALFANPLAEPYVTGVSSGAALGASIAFALVLEPFPWATVAALLGSFFTLLFVCSIARMSRGIDVFVLLLAGVAVSSLFSAAVSIVMVRSGRDLHSLIFWLMGSLSARSWREVVWCLPVLPLLLVPAYYHRELNILLHGEERAAQLGVDAPRVRFILFTIASALAAIAVAVSGIIGFVGLIVPHLVRLIVGPDHRTVLPASLILGAGVMVLSDAAARTVFAPAEMPVGVVTAFFGAPFFLYLLWRMRHVRSR